MVNVHITITGENGTTLSKEQGEERQLQVIEAVKGVPGLFRLNPVPRLKPWAVEGNEKTTRVDVDLNDINQADLEREVAELIFDLLHQREAWHDVTVQLNNSTLTKAAWGRRATRVKKKKKR